MTMNDQQKTYVEFKAGGPVCAEEFNLMQERICADIQTQIAAAVAELTDIANAGNSEKLAGETPQELLDRFLEKAMQEFPTQTGYRMVIKRLVHGELRLIEHGLKRCPLVDVYELKSFDVVCAHDDDRHVEEVKMFLYHSSERKIRNPDPDAGGPGSITIEETNGPAFKYPLFEYADLLGVTYNDESSLQDFEAEFWEKMFEDPSDALDPEEFCHSPWFERCCREERTVGSLKEKGDADELFLKMIKAKTINPGLTTTDDDGNDGDRTERCPRDVTVAQVDLNTVGLLFQTSETRADGEPPRPLCVAVLLKV
ncbi:MAG: hypothetical protein AAFX81_12220 [Pseudomonadota bacterium]